MTIREVLFSQNSEKFQAIDNYNKAMEGNYSLEDAMVAMDKLNVWDLESRMSQILGKLDIYDLEQRVGSLSGGQKKRVALSAILIEEPDLILMDEPTNHLDPEMIEWLENYLRSRELTLLVITHDRYFLDAVCNQIVELENGKMQKYAGTYAYYLEKKNLQMDILFSQNEKMKNIFRREKEWMSKQPKARTTKAKSRIQNFDTIEENTVLKPKKDELKLETVENRLGSKILEFHKAYKSFGTKKILENFDYKFKRNEKVGIVGKNGVGKTTFLNLIMGLEKPDKGEVVLGETVKIGYYRQENNEFDGEKRMIEIIKDVAEHIPLKGGKSYTASQMLERFLFPGHMHYVFVKKLSGGEKRRLSLIRTLMLNPNFLILDEPTNDLDIITLNVLQEFIEEFEGCVIVISHDRYFMDNCVEHLFCFEGNGKVRDYYGTYTEYRNELQDTKYTNTESKPETDKTTETKTSSKSQNKMSFNEQREFSKIEDELPKLEIEQLDLSSKLTESLSFEELQKVTDRLSVIAKTIEDYNLRWLELAEKMG
jgi:ATP-binding cassette subfamily F protein uup